MRSSLLILMCLGASLVASVPVQSLESEAVIRRVVRVAATERGKIEQILPIEQAMSPPPPLPDSMLGRNNGPTEVVVCRGVGDLVESQFKDLGAAWKRYATSGIVTAVSPLLYKLSPDGQFSSYGPNLEAWSHKYLKQKGAKYLPHVFCDTTCCQTCVLPQSLEAAMLRRKVFFAESAKVAQDNGLDGYALDFEGTMPQRKMTSQFFKEWKEDLSRYTSASGKPLELHLWMPTAVDESTVAPSMNSMITMNSYSETRWDNPVSSSLLELGNTADLVKNQVTASSWRKLRAQALLNATGSVNSICPATNGKEASSTFSRIPHRGTHGASMGAQASVESVARLRAERVAGIKKMMKGWCHRVQRQHGSCGMGLITYDMGNRHLGCTDLVDVAMGAHHFGMNSVWIWSGGIIPKSWERGLWHFAQNLHAEEDSSSFAQICAQDTERFREGRNALLTQLAQKYKRQVSSDQDRGGGSSFMQVADMEMADFFANGGVESLSEAQILALTPELDALCGCNFDGNYCCDGSLRKPLDF